jgi:hypothetical protein
MSKKKKDYCTENGGDCGTCSLVNYSRDCMNQELGSEDDLSEDEEGAD